MARVWRFGGWPVALAVGAVLVLGGCASTAALPPAGEAGTRVVVSLPPAAAAPVATPTEASASAAAEFAPAVSVAPPVVRSRIDPWEGWNRKVFRFNDRLDAAFIKPVAVAYTKVLPQPVRTGVTNFYGNFTDAWSAVNNLLQGKFTNSLQDVARVGTNVILGLTVFDVATELGWDRQGEDLGQTLGRWGVPQGPYVVWPFLGPSTVRDSVALPFDRMASPSLFVDGGVGLVAIAGLGLVSERADLLATTRMLDDMALDRYSFVRDGYLQRRRSLVFDGDEPLPPDESVETAPSLQK